MQFPRNTTTAWSCADTEKLLQPSCSLGIKEGTWREGGRAKDEKGDRSNVSLGIRLFARKDGSGSVPYLSYSDTRMLESDLLILNDVMESGSNQSSVLLLTSEQDVLLQVFDMLGGAASSLIPGPHRSSLGMR